MLRWVRSEACWSAELRLDLCTGNGFLHEMGEFPLAISPLRKPCRLFLETLGRACFDACYFWAGDALVSLLCQAALGTFLSLVVLVSDACGGARWRERGSASMSFKLLILFCLYKVYDTLYWGVFAPSQSHHVHCGWPKARCDVPTMRRSSAHDCSGG